MLLTYARQAPKLEGNSNGGVGTDRHSPLGYRHHGYQHPHEEFGACIDSLKISLFQQKLSSVQEPEAREEQTIAGIIRYLQEHLAKEVSLSVLAGVFHLNPQYIRQLFKSEIGVNFLTYLTNIRIENAKKLLLSTSLSIAEVAEQSGYGDYRVFTKVFKKTEGVTPSQYRRDFLDETQT